MSEVNSSAGNVHLTRSIAIVGLLFFIMGFFTWINGPLITFVRLAFDLNDVNAFLILMVFYLSYFFFALPASWILKGTGLKKGLALSLVVLAAGAALFGELATRRWYPGALGGLFVIGGGLALLQTAVNPYICIIGPIESAARRIAVMGICSKSAGILAPLVIGSLVLQGIGDLASRLETAEAAARAQLLDAFAANIHLPYMIMAGILLLVAVGILASPLPEMNASEVNAAPARDVVKKQLVTNLVGCPTLGAPARETQTNPLLDNYEGMTIIGGPGLAEVSLISDDNFSATQFTRVLNLAVRLP